MRKILVLVGVLAVVAALAAGAGAWFTDDATLPGDQIVTTGSLDIHAYWVDGHGPVSVANLEPGAGYTEAGIFCVENVGD